MSMQPLHVGHCPPAFGPILPLARACREGGGRALVVGGAPRDLVMALRRQGGSGEVDFGFADLDVEVHGVERGPLERILRSLGPVNLVGNAFAVYKLDLAGQVVDVSLPRRDSKSGAGHKGFRVVGDPHMGLEEAARRRDLTINALALDPLTCEVLDPWGGVADLEARILRPVDVGTFLDDPLRALRVLQFAGRFGFDLHPSLDRLCREAPLLELPPERVRGEVHKLLLRSPRPSWGLQHGVRLQVWHRVLPQVLATEDGFAAVDRAADAWRQGGWRSRIQVEGDPPGEALTLAALLHGSTIPDATEALDRLGIHSQEGFPVRQAALLALSRWRDLTSSLSDGDLRLLARDAEGRGGLGLLALAARVIQGDPALDSLLARTREMGILLAAPRPLLKGRDLLGRGFRAGPALGRELERLYTLQLAQGVEDRDRLLEQARSDTADP